MTLDRRAFLLGFGAAIAAPAIVRAGSLMPVRVIPFDPLNVHVDPTGSDIFGDGSFLKPFASIKRALETLNDWRPLTVCIGSGHYEEGPVIVPPKSHVVLWGEGLDETVFESLTGPIFWVNYQATLDIRNMSMKGASCP
jgi:hypothetical protein